MFELFLEAWPGLVLVAGLVMVLVVCGGSCGRDD